MTEQNVMTPEEVAETLKITKNTVYELIKRGELLAYKVGNKVRVDQSDLDDYINKSKGCGYKYNQNPHVEGFRSANLVTESKNSDQLIICGQDHCLDILANTLQYHPLGVPVLRSYVGSFAGLISLYHDSCQVTASHLWDSDGNIYNTPYVRRLLPGIPCVIIHIAKRVQGFYVAKGNPKKIAGWADLTRSDITLINREKGSGTRVLLDEHLRLLAIDSNTIQGYHNEETSHLSIASSIARNKADVGIGCENIVNRMPALDFIPLQKESYDIIIKKSNLNHPIYQLIYEIINSESYKNELDGLGGYDLSQTGMMIDET